MKATDAQKTIDAMKRAAAKGRRRTWEYTVLGVLCWYDADALGADGWELVAVSNGEAFFKREVVS